ncbi:MAG: type II secretion system protein GspC [Pseudomonadota bacterium]
MDIAAVNRFSTPTNVVLALLIGFVAAQIVIDLLPKLVPTTATTRSVEGTTSRGVSAQSMAQEIANLHLFGKATSKPVVVESEPTNIDAPETQLNLTLHGVLAYDPPEQALAIISSGGKKETIYAIGDKIVGNTTLQAVHPDRVIIRRSGKDETLRLPEKVASLGGASTASQATQPATNASNSNLDNLPSNAKELRDRIVKEPSIMADLVVMRPYKRNGQLVGFRIQPKRDPTILRNFGIEPGDVITSVNGVALTSNRDGITALGKLRKAKSVDLVVLRGGSEVPVSVSLE